MLITAPPPVEAPVWLERPTPAALARAQAGFRRGSQAETATMTCFVLADGRLTSCSGAPSLIYVADAYRLDRATYPDSRVVVQEILPKQYDREPVQVSGPTPAQLLAAGGAQPVSFLCRISEVGRAEDCAPAGARAQALESIAAAQPLLSRFAFTPAQLNGAPVSAYRVVSVALGRHTVTNPDWVRRPTGDDMGHLYPAEAIRLGASGETRIRCAVTEIGTMTKCDLLQEAPDGLGFGAAALAAAELFQMRPQTIDGRPVAGALVTIPMTWRGAAPQSRITTVRMQAWLPFVAAPDDAAVRQAFARVPASQGAVMVNFLCRLQSSGGLGTCETEGQHSAWATDNAARTLLKRFTVDPSVMKIEGARDWLLRVSVTDSPRMRSGATRYVHQIDWVKEPLQEGGEVFPAKAAAAGLLKGTAVVDCTVNASGKLQGCSVVREAPAAYGFGELSLQMAAAMQANLWTRDGEPTVGAHVSLPLTFIYHGETARSAAAAKVDAKP